MVRTVKTQFDTDHSFYLHRIHVLVASDILRDVIRFWRRPWLKHAPDCMRVVLRIVGFQVKFSMELCSVASWSAEEISDNKMREERLFTLQR